MYKWLYGGEEEEGMGEKPAVSGAVTADITGKEEDICIAELVYTTNVPFQDNAHFKSGVPIVTHPGSEPNHVPFSINVDNDDDISSIGQFTAGRSKIEFMGNSLRGNQPISQVNQSRPFPSDPLDTVSEAKTWASGQEPTLASSYKIPGKSVGSSKSGSAGHGDIGLSLGQEDELICSSKASESVFTGKPHSIAGSIATTSHMPSSVPSSASSYITTPYSIVVIIAPPGKLGLNLVNCIDGHSGTIVNSVDDDSPLNNILFDGDRIIGIDGQDVSLFSRGDHSNFTQEYG